MLRTYRLAAAGDGTSAGQAGLFALATALWILYVAAPGAFAQDRVPASKSRTASEDGRGGTATAAIDDPNLDSSDDGKANSRAAESESLLSGIAKASGPVVVVTLVIAAMSFYLIALVVWMALNYRTSTTMPAALVAKFKTCSTRPNITKPTTGWSVILRSWPAFLRPESASCPRGWPRPSEPLSSPTKARRWRWNIARPIWPPSEHSGP